MKPCCTVSDLKALKCELLCLGLYGEDAGPVQVLHSISSQRLEVVESMESHVDRTVLPILKDVEACWQPTDFLPDSSSPDFVDEVRISVRRE